ncbi:hypothetical protein BB559_005700, partial [Furculomyces boomerangus]
NGETDDDYRKKKSRKREKVDEPELSVEGNVIEVNEERGEIGSKKDVPSDGRTENERKFKEVQEKRKRSRIEKLISKSHKEKVQEFNEKLDRLPEHHDMPKVGPG